MGKAGVFLFFIDGVGLGRRDPAANPFMRARLPHLTHLLGGRPFLAESFPPPGAPPAPGGPHTWLAAVDPALGVRGLPQSATGQTTILTGVNAARAIGRHLNGWPSPRLRALLYQHSLFKQVLAQGHSAAFLNAYRPEFFAWLAAGRPEAGGGARGAAGAGAPSLPGARRALQRYRPSATTVAVLAAGLPFRTLQDLERGEAVYHDITGQMLADAGYAVAPVAPAEAGRRAAAALDRYDFVLFEHFLTDLAGHSQDMAQAVALLERVDAFLGGLLAALDPARHLLILISDHGNIEDLSVRTHTMNPVPGICWGRGAAAAAARLRDLTGVAPAVLAALAGGTEGE